MQVDRDKVRALAREAATFLPDTAGLLRGLLGDERVPRRAKVEAGLALGYLVVPLDLVPDFVPGVGQLDDVAVVAWALRRLLMAAGEDVVREHWLGTDRGLEVLLQVAALGLRPKQLLGALVLGGLTGRDRGR